MTDRERFEAWAKDMPREFDLVIQTDISAWPGQYDDYITQCAWEGWQAATAAAEQDKWAAVRRCAQVCEKAEIQTVAAKGRETAARIKVAIKVEFPEAFK